MLIGIAGMVGSGKSTLTRALAARFGLQHALESVDDETHEARVHVPGPQVMDQWGTGVGGPQTMPHPEADKGLFQPAGV